MGIVKDFAELTKQPSGCLIVWFSELNYYFTKYAVSTLEELDDLLWYDYGVDLIVR